MARIHSAVSINKTVEKFKKRAKINIGNEKFYNSSVLVNSFYYSTPLKLLEPPGCITNYRTFCIWKKWSRRLYLSLKFRLSNDPRCKLFGEQFEWNFEHVRLQSDGNLWSERPRNQDETSVGTPIRLSNIVPGNVTNRCIITFSPKRGGNCRADVKSRICKFSWRLTRCRNVSTGSLSSTMRLEWKISKARAVMRSLSLTFLRAGAIYFFFLQAVERGLSAARSR